MNWVRLLQNKILHYGKNFFSSEKAREFNEEFADRDMF